MIAAGQILVGGFADPKVQQEDQRMKVKICIWWKISWEKKANKINHAWLKVDLTKNIILWNTGVKVGRRVYTSIFFQEYQRIVMLQVVNNQFFFLELFITLRPPSKNITFNSKDVKPAFVLVSLLCLSSKRPSCFFNKSRNITAFYSYLSLRLQ